MLNAKLVVVGGEVKTTEIKLKLPCVIGRGKGSNVTLPHPLVSRQHCELFEAGGKLWVRDLGSLNGTYVNNEKITEMELPPGELLTVGTVTFRAVYEQLANTSPPSGPGPQVKSARAPSAREEETTIRLDEPDSVDEIPSGEVVDEEAADAEEITSLPSTPLFETSEAPGKSHPTVPMTQRPTQPGAQRPPSIPLAVTPGAPTSGKKGDEAEVAGQDDDLEDFLKSLGKK